MRAGEDVRRPLIEIAIQRDDWETAALCLLYGVAAAARQLPAGAVDELLDMLAGADDRAGQDRRSGARERRGG